jgi:hypothetical protein
VNILSEKSKKRSQKQHIVQKTKKVDEKNIQKLSTRLNELKKKHKFVDIAICPKCKSPNLRRVKSTSGDITGHLGWLPVIYECLDCGWRGQIKLLATNKNQSWKEVAIIAEARDIQKEKKNNY